MNYKAIIFDLDGTLIESMQIWRKVDAEFLGKRDIVVPADLFDHLPNGNSFIQTAQYFKDRFGLGDSVESIMQEWTDMVTHHYSHDIQLKPSAKELVQHLNRFNIPIGHGTSKSLFLAEKVLALNGVLQYFSALVTGEQVAMGKPFPDIYLACAKKLGVNPEDCLAVEDTLSGVRAAKAAGMKVFAVYDEDSKLEQDQIKHEADQYIQDLKEILEYL
jgi:HAD superfamily hydrolase (TIGR01549 family)